MRGKIFKRLEKGMKWISVLSIFIFVLKFLDMIIALFGLYAEINDLKDRVTVGFFRFLNFDSIGINFSSVLNRTKSTSAPDCVLQ